MAERDGIEPLLDRLSVAIRTPDLVVGVLEDLATLMLRYAREDADDPVLAYTELNVAVVALNGITAARTERNADRWEAMCSAFGEAMHELEALGAGEAVTRLRRLALDEAGRQ